MGYTIYCDGATSKNGHKDATGGAAWALLKDESLIKTNSWKIKPATNNICELEAMIDACNYIVSLLAEVDSVTIYSDSSYIINCYNQFWWKAWLHNNWVNSKKEPVKNRELWEKLIPYFQDARFHFVKVKGHSGNSDWNDYVDKLAVAAKGEINGKNSNS